MGNPLGAVPRSRPLGKNSDNPEPYVIRIRVALKGPLAAPLLWLALVWVGVAIPIADQGLAHDTSPAVADVDSDGSTLSHDHRLCVLFQSSPGWVSPSPALRGRPVVPTAARPWNLMTWIPRRTSSLTLARAPPLPI